MIYKNDLSNAHKSTEFVLFADDTNIFVKVCLFFTPSRSGPDALKFFIDN